jgi:hypothetical protein
MAFDGLICDMGTICRLSTAVTRSISAENPTGEKAQGGRATTGTGAGCARDLGVGWKISPSVVIPPGTTLTLADVAGPGAIQSMWMAGSWHPRFNVLRMYWDGQERPSVETPLGDFFCNAYGRYAQVSSLAVCVNPGNNSALNCYWPMPFRRHARITVTNIHTEPVTLYYQINYALGPVPEDAAYFHAQFRRVNPLPYKEVYTILDGVQGNGHYAGTYMAWGVNNNGWWGEGEIKFFLDGDTEFPTICGTGTEDYFCGAYNWDIGGQYREYTTPYAGMFQVLRPDGTYQSQHRHGMYRWHIPDPIRFRDNIRVTIQALGWRSGGRYLPMQDDIASVAYWYQTLPTAPFPKVPDKDYLEII